MRPEIESLPGSRIREVANAGLGRSDVLAFWFGESDEVTPAPIREAAVRSLQALPGLQVALPAGGMYAFLRMLGQDDSLALAKRLVREHALGLAPGAAFGAEGEGWLRWCFASRDPARLDQGLARLAGALGL